MDEHTYREWCAALYTLQTMITKQLLRFGNETTPRVFCSNLKRYAEQMEALLPKKGE